MCAAGYSAQPDANPVGDLVLALASPTTLAILYKSASLKGLVMITVTSMEAQNRFGQLLDTVQREPVIITRHGRTVALMMTPEVFQAQTQAHHQPQDAFVQAGLNAIAVFRGAGKQGSVALLLQDRQADRLAELRKETSA